MKRFFVFCVVALCSLVAFSSCKDDKNDLKYDEVLEGKWLVESISPATDETYLVEGSVVEFKADHTFVLHSQQWGDYFKTTSWVTQMERDTTTPYLIMLGMDGKDESTHVVLEGRINLSGNDTVYLDCDDAYIQGVVYTFKLVRQK